MSHLIDNKTEADSILARIIEAAQAAEIYVQRYQRPHPDLVAVLRGLRQTRVGRDVYFAQVEERKKDFERRTAEKKEQVIKERGLSNDATKTPTGYEATERITAPSKRDLLRMRKTDLKQYAEALGVDTSGTREDIVERLEKAGVC